MTVIAIIAQGMMGAGRRPALSRKRRRSPHVAVRPQCLERRTRAESGDGGGSQRARAARGRRFLFVDPAAWRSRGAGATVWRPL